MFSPASPKLHSYRTMTAVAGDTVAVNVIGRPASATTGATTSVTASRGGATISVVCDVPPSFSMLKTVTRAVRAPVVV